MGWREKEEGEELMKSGRDGRIMEEKGGLRVEKQEKTEKIKLRIQQHSSRPRILGIL